MTEDCGINGRGGGQIFYEWGSASHRKLFMWWWVAGVEGWGVGVEGRQRGHSFIWCWRGEKEMKREGGGKNSVNERVMERTVRERERGRPHRMNESDTHSSMASLLAELQPWVHYVSWAARAHVTSQKHGRSPGERVIQRNKHGFDWMLYMDLLHPGWLNVVVQILLLTPVCIYKSVHGFKGPVHPKSTPVIISSLHADERFSGASQ